MNALKSLTLKLDDTRTEDLHLFELAQGLHPFDFLKHLTVSLSGNPLTLKGAANLLTEVSKLPRLASLHVNLRRINDLVACKDDLKNITQTLRVASLTVHH